MINRIVKVLGSLRFTLVIILALSLIFLLGLWIPQKGLLRQAQYLEWKVGSPDFVAFLEVLGFTDIYTSPITLALWVLFFLNLSFVMWKRIPVVRRKVAFSETKLEDPAGTAAYPYKDSVVLSGPRDEAVLPLSLAKARYRFYGTPRRFYAVRNRFSPLATLLFHLSFFLMLLGGVMSVYTKFAGRVDLAEGEVFQGAPDQYRGPRRLPKIGSVPDARFLVQSIRPIVEHDTPTGITVVLLDEQRRRHIVQINQPYKTGNTSFVIQNLGVAPLIILQDGQGKELDGAYVKLDVLMGKQDGFIMAGLKFTADFFPDYVVTGSTEGTRSQEVRNPAFRFHVERDQRFLAKRTILPGSTAAFEDYRMLVPEMRYWVRFYVVKERGLGIIYAGFAVATAALIWRLIFYRRELVGSVVITGETSMLSLAGRAEFYKALFQDEFERLKQRLGKERTG